MKNLIKREQNKQVCFAESENSRTKFKRFIVSLMAMMSVLTMTAQSSVYDFTVKDDAGKDVSLADYKGKVLLIVNTATRCGFTPQYKELEALYEKYAKDGFEILDFPCNQFGEQAPGSIQEIHQFCTANFDIQFPQFDKIDVNGANEHPLYTYLKSQKGFGGFDTTDQRGKFMDERCVSKMPITTRSPISNGISPSSSSAVMVVY